MPLNRREEPPPLRLGRRSGPPRWYWLVGGGAALVCGAVATALLTSEPSAAKERGEEPSGECQSDADCRARHICLSGGCAPLLASQDPLVWHADLDEQLAKGANWTPPLEPGETIPAAATCPAPRGTVAPSEPGKVRTLVDMSIYEVRAEALRIHRYIKAIGSIWVDNLGFDFPRRLKIDPLDVCSGPSVSHVSVLQGVSESLPGQVLTKLRQAVPSETPTAASVSVRFDPPSQNPDGTLTLTVPLSAASRNITQVTVIALPIGTQVESMRGPAPTKQRLLHGFFAYYFDHARPSEIAISYRTSQPTTGELDIPTVRP